MGTLEFGPLKLTADAAAELGGTVREVLAIPPNKEMASIANGGVRLPRAQKIAVTPSGKVKGSQVMVPPPLLR